MSLSIWDATSQKANQVAGNATNDIQDGVVSTDSTWSSKKITDSLVDIKDFKQTTGSIIGTGVYVSHREYENSMMKCFEINIRNNTGADVQVGADVQIGQLVGIDATKQIFIPQTSYTGETAIAPSIDSSGRLTARILASDWKDVYSCTFRIVIFKN